MASELQVKIKRSFLDNYLRPLHLHPEFIMFEDKDLVNNKFTRFKTSEIKEFRYGIKWYRYHFVFGREYQIYVRNHSNEVLKINFNSYFGIKKYEYYELYASIINSIWDLYFKNYVYTMLKEFDTGESFYVGDVNINPEGVIILVSKLFKQEKKLIPWQDVRIKKYQTYISVYSNQNPMDFNRGYYYKEDWNTFVLFEVLKNILASKNIVPA